MSHLDDRIRCADCAAVASVPDALKTGWYHYRSDDVWVCAKCLAEQREKLRA